MGNQTVQMDRFLKSCHRIYIIAIVRRESYIKVILGVMNKQEIRKSKISELPINN